MRGPAGLGFGGFYIDDDGLVQPVDTEGNPMGDPVAMEIADISSIDGGTPSSPMTETLDGGGP
jgi:hypothetical protein